MREYSKPDSFYERYNENRYGLLIITAIVSFLIHYFLYVRMADMRFDVTAEVPEKYRAQKENNIVNFEHIAEDPFKTLPAPEFGDSSAKPGVGMSSDELSQILEAPVMTFSAPPVSQPVLEAATIKEVKVSEIAPADHVWQPRQEIIKVVDKIVRDDVALMPRREIFAIERIQSAPDYAPAVELSKDIKIPVLKSNISPKPLAGVGTKKDVKPKPVQSVAEEIRKDSAIKPNTALTQFGEKPGEITDFQAVDSRLSISTEISDKTDKYGRKYFKLTLFPRDNASLPVVPKDIVFVQDASRSLAMQRLHFCKAGLINSLAFLKPEDRFNVVSFRDNATFCFPGGWAKPTEANILAATTFIKSLNSEGNTDLFESLKSLLSLPRDPARPLVVVVITDGKATTGITQSSRIIGEFSKLNDNMSLYVLGTHGNANGYLLDMLSFCNRGEQFIVTTGRWDIPQAIERLVANCKDPILGRIGVTTDSASKAEIFPLPSANLYAGKPLVYYGSCDSDTQKIVLQVRGEGGKAKCDIIYDIDLANAIKSNIDLKAEWAKRKMHTLVGAYARDPNRDTLLEMQRLSIETGLPIPYYGEF